jgi:hypothetical protein
VPRHLIARHVQIGVAVDDPAGLHPAAAGSAPCQGRPPPTAGKRHGVNADACHHIIG